MGRFLGESPSFTVRAHCLTASLQPARSVWIQVLIIYSWAESIKSASARHASLASCLLALRVPASLTHDSMQGIFPM